MGRRKLHDETTGTGLVEAAERIVEAEGVAALTVRRVAHDMGVTTRAVYSTFGSKDGLLAALGTQAFDLLGRRVAGPAATDDAVSDLVDAGAVGFRGFVLAHPALFQVAFRETDLPAEVGERVTPVAGQAFGALMDRVTRVEAGHGLGNRTIDEAAMEFHCLCEGLALAELRGHVRTGENAEGGWRQALGALVAGWATPRGQAPANRPRPRSTWLTTS